MVSDRSRSAAHHESLNAEFWFWSEHAIAAQHVIPLQSTYSGREIARCASRSSQASPGGASHVTTWSRRDSRGCPHSDSSTGSPATVTSARGAFVACSRSFARPCTASHAPYGPRPQNSARGYNYKSRLAAVRTNSGRARVWTRAVAESGI